jgi:hypothetical protein
MGEGRVGVASNFDFFRAFITGDGERPFFDGGRWATLKQSVSFFFQ